MTASRMTMPLIRAFARLLGVRRARPFQSRPAPGHRRPHGAALGFGIRIFLVELEVDGEVEDDVDRLAVHRARLEDPLLHRIDGSLGQPVRQSFENFESFTTPLWSMIVSRITIPLMRSCARFLRIERIHVDDHHRRLDIAADGIGLGRSQSEEGRRRTRMNSLTHAIPPSANCRTFSAPPRLRVKNLLRARHALAVDRPDEMHPIRRLRIEA